MKKSTQLDEVAAKKLFEESPWSLKFRPSALQGFVQGKGPGTHWPSAIEELKTLEIRPDNGGERRLSRGLENMVAREWAKSDLGKAMEWYVDDLGADLSNPQDAAGASYALQSLPADERYRAVDWIERRRSDAGWNDLLIVNYGQSISRFVPDAETERLVGFLSNEDDRYSVVAKIVKTAKSSGRTKSGESLESFENLITNANLSEKRTATLRNVIAPLN
jgi:hypothetical protein